MILTLNQVVKRLETLALSHKQINHFYIGDIFDWLQSGKVQYPACFIDFSTGDISKANRQTRWDFEIWFCDLGNIAIDTNSNDIEAQSDLTNIAQDYKAMLAYSGYQRDWSIDDDSPLAFFRQKFDDLVLAVRMNVSISTGYASDRCQVPADNVEFEQDKYSMIVTNFTYTGAGTEGNSLTVATLQNKSILLLLKGDKTLTPILYDESSTPNENQYMFNRQTGGFVFGTDIEENQIIQILNN